MGAVLLLFFWLVLGRVVERYTSRDYFRAMLEHMPPPSTTVQKKRKEQQRQQTANTTKNGTATVPAPTSSTTGTRSTTMMEKIQYALHISFAYIDRWMQRLWDAICPLPIQRLIFIPQWNKRTHSDLLQHVRFWRSIDRKEHRYVFHTQYIYMRVPLSISVRHLSYLTYFIQFFSCSLSYFRPYFRASTGRGLVFPDHRPQDGAVDIGDPSLLQKVLVCTLVALGSFTASSPHFFLNLLTVFSSSVSLVSNHFVLAVEFFWCAFCLTFTPFDMLSTSLVDVF